MSDPSIETGLVGLTANPAPEPAPQVPVVVTAPVPMPDGWTVHRAAALMRDLAQEMFSTPVILKKHGLTEAQYNVMKENEFFKSTLQAMIVEWHSAANTPKRLALEALMALEDKLPDVAARMGAKTEPLSSVVQLAALLAKIGGLGEGKADSAPTEKFKITINLGADIERFDKSHVPIQIFTGTEESTSSGSHAPLAIEACKPS